MKEIAQGLKQKPKENKKEKIRDLEFDPGVRRGKANRRSCNNKWKERGVQNPETQTKTYALLDSMLAQEKGKRQNSMSPNLCENHPQTADLGNEGFLAHGHASLQQPEFPVTCCYIANQLQS